MTQKNFTLFRYETKDKNDFMSVLVECLHCFTYLNYNRHKLESFIDDELTCIHDGIKEPIGQVHIILNKFVIGDDKLYRIVVTFQVDVTDNLANKMFNF